MEVLVQWFTDNLSQHISRELIIFIISMIPILELRGGLLAASLLKVSAAKAENQGNVIKLDHNQFISTNRYAAVELKVTLEAYGTEHKKKIVKALEEAGCKPKIIRANL